jgi:hypothetical protein
MSTHRPLLALVLAALVSACVDFQPSAPEVDRAASSAPVAAARRLGADAEFERIARAVPGFGGMYYDGSGRLNVFITGASSRSAQGILNALGEVTEALRAQGRIAPLADDIIVLEGRRDYLELTALHDRVFPVLSELGAAFLDIDETRNQLVLGVLGGTSTAGLQARVQSLGVPMDAIAFEVTPPIAPLSNHTLRDLQDPIGGGLQIGFEDSQYVYLCTLGFNVLRGAALRDSNHFFTNSHCTLDMGSVTGVEYWMPFSPGLGAGGTFVGVEVEDPPFVPGICIAPWLCRWSDAAMVRLQEGIPTDVGAIYRTTSFGTGASPGSIEIDAAQRTFRIADEQPWPLVGEIVNKMGRTSGWTRGPVTRNCVSIARSLNPPTALACQIIVAAHSDFGDSGSPVFAPLGSSSSVRLYGILWGGPASAPFNFFVFSTMDGIREDFDGPSCRLTGPEFVVRCPRDRTFVTH